MWHKARLIVVLIYMCVWVYVSMSCHTPVITITKDALAPTTNAALQSERVLVMNVYYGMLLSLLFSQFRDRTGPPSGRRKVKAHFFVFGTPSGNSAKIKRLTEFSLSYILQIHFEKLIFQAVKPVDPSTLNLITTKNKWRFIFIHFSPVKKL